MEIQAPDRNTSGLLQPDLNQSPLQPSQQTVNPNLKPDLNQIPLPPQRGNLVNVPEKQPLSALTEDGRKQEVLNRIMPQLEESDGSHNYQATMADSIRRAVIEDGLASNLVRWIDQKHASIADPDPVQAQQIREAMPELMRGLAPSDQDYLESLPTFELAEREAQRLRDQYWWQQATEDDGFLKGIVSGIGGFLLDPLNLVPGAMLYKGANLTSKTAMAVGGTGHGLNLAKGSIGSNVLKWGALGGAEEIIRAYPRLQADPLFREREYWEAIMFAGGFGAAVPALPLLGRLTGSIGERGVIELENAYRNISNSSAGIALAQTLRTTRSVLADLDTSSAKAFRQQDKGQLWQDKKAATLKKQDEGGQVKKKSYKQSQAEATETFKSGQYQKMSDEAADQVADALINAGVMTKDAAIALAKGVKFTGEVAGKVVTHPAVQKAAKKAGKAVAKQAKERAKLMGRLADRNAQQVMDTLVDLDRTLINSAQNVGTIGSDVARVLKKVKEKQSKIDAESNPDIGNQMKAAEAKAQEINELSKKQAAANKSESVSKPDYRGEIKDRVDELERIVDYDGPGFGADTAGAARVHKSRWTKFKEEAKGAQEQLVYQAREAVEDLKVKRDEMLAQLPEASSAELRRNINYIFDEKINSLNAVADAHATKHGVRPRMQQIPTANEQVMGTFRHAYTEMEGGLKALDARLNEISPDFRKVGVGAEIKDAYHDALTRAVLDSKIPEARNVDLGVSNPMHTMQVVLDALPSNSKKAKFMQRFSDNLEKYYTGVREDLSFENLTTKQIDQMLELVDDTVDHIAGKINTMEAQFLAPLENTLGVNPVHAAMSRDFQASGWQPLIEEQFVNNKRNQALAKQAGGLTHSLQSQILASGAPLQQNLGLRLFETSAGFGGDRVAPTNTAAIVANNLHNEVHIPYLRAYDTFQKEWAKEQNWSWLQEKKNYKGHAEGYSDIAKMNEALMIAQNQRRLGKPQFHGPDGYESAAITKMLDATDAAYAKIHELQMESGIEGVSAQNQIKHHQKQVWNDEKILQLTSAPGGVEAATQLIQKGLMSAGLDEAGAYTLAQGFLDAKHAALHSPRLGGNQKLTQQTVNGAMPSILEITEKMRGRGVDELEVSRLTAAINETVGEIDGPGYLQHQLKLDYEASVNWNGKELRVVDLLDLDTAGHLERQSKESTALVAINDAFDGKMNSYQAIEDYLDSMAKEAHAMGAKNLSREIRNGIGMMTGTEYDGQLPKRMRMIRGHLQLTSMGGLMESQLAEAGLAITRGSASIAALKQVKDARRATRQANRGRDVYSMPPALQENKALLDELHAITSNTPDMYQLQRNNVVFDAQDLGIRGEQLQGLDRGLDIATGGKYRPALKSVQTNLTGYGKIRSMEDDIAGMSVLNDMARLFIDPKTGELNPPGKGSSSTSEARWRDMGLDTSEQSTIRKLFDPYEGHIVVDETTGNIRNLNIEDWSIADRRKMGVILERNASRQIQKGFVGESSPTLMNPWWAFLTQFRSYTMIAAEKQQVRNLKFADKEMATGMVLNAGTSAISRMIRIYSLSLAQPMEDREAYIRNRMDNIGYETIKYMAMAATIPELSGMINQAVGQPFGAHPAGSVRGADDLIPALSYFQRLMEAQQAGIPSSDAERARLQSLIQLGTIKQANVLFGLLRTWLDD